jgi:protein-S-isoprenylcysteine O-methyltransferase Ste14
MRKEQFLPIKGPKIHRSFPRLVLGVAFILLCIFFTKDLALAGRGPLWPGVALIALGFLIRFWGMGHIEKGKALATGGPYGLCRNPLYLGSLINGAGIAVAAEAWYVLAIGIVPLTIAYYIMIRGEEEGLAAQFGDSYVEYRKSVPALLPLPTRYFWHPAERFHISVAMKNRGWACFMYFAFTFLAVDLAVFVLWPVLLNGVPLDSALGNYFTNFISNHF